MTRRRWAVGLLAGAVVLSAAGAAALSRRHSCGEDVVSRTAAESSSPFLDADGRRARPDPDRDTLVRAFTAMPAPFGEVVGAVGYHYDQWAQLSAYDQGLGVRTRDNPDFTMLDDKSLEPRWSVRVGTRQSTYDADSRTYVVVTLPKDRAPEVVALDADTGRRRWCTRLPGLPATAQDSVRTAFVDGDVAVLRPNRVTRIEGDPRVPRRLSGRLVRLSGRDGHEVWSRAVPAGTSEYLGAAGPGELVAGGTPRALLLDPGRRAGLPKGPTISAVDVRTGATDSTWGSPGGGGGRVVGTDPEQSMTVLETWSGDGQRLVGLRDGEQVWEIKPPGTSIVDSAVRGGRVLARTTESWSAYDVTSGRLSWVSARPAAPRGEFLPYGFELDAMPLLDDDHALIGGTTGLHVLDLRDGSMTSAPLPTDGFNTTYWPYQVVVTPGLVAVATNTGAVVLRRE